MKKKLCILLCVMAMVVGMHASEKRIRRFEVANRTDRGFMIKLHPFSNAWFKRPKFDAVCGYVGPQEIGSIAVPVGADGVVISGCDGYEKEWFEEIEFLKIRDGKFKGERYGYGLVAIDSDEKRLLRIVPLFYKTCRDVWRTVRVVDPWEF